MTRVRTLLAVVALTLVATAVAARGGAPPAAAAGGACASLDDGVTVVVDFQHLGGGAVTRCAPGDPDSGLAALAAAGFRVDQVANQPGFVCRLDGLPGPDAEDCGDTPPASAYWGYSHAERGGSWSYAGSGAHVYDPPVGTVEGWAFNGDGGSTRPTVPPPPPPEPEPEPEPEPSAGGGEVASEPDRDPQPGRTSQPHTSAAAAGGATTGPTPEPTPDDRSAPAGGGTGAAPAASPTDGPAPSTSPGRASSGEVLAATPDPSPRAAPAATSGAGTPWPTAVAALAVAGLVGAGVALRRRREGAT